MNSGRTIGFGVEAPDSLSSNGHWSGTPTNEALCQSIPNDYSEV